MLTPRSAGFAAAGIKSAFAFPVKIKNETVAILEFFDRSSKLHKDRSLENLVSTIGTQLGRIEERRRSQDNIDVSHKQMVKSARMAAVGELAGGIAHEINNPLAIIQAHISRIRRSPGRDDADIRIEDSSEKIIETVDRMTKIISGLKSVARESTNEPYESIKIKSLVKDALELASERYGAFGIDLRTDPIDPELEINCRPTQILQVLVNLLNNAFDAVIESKIRWVYFEVDVIGEYFEFAVNDSGEGVPEKIREQVMDPFFTTKPLGKGTGLGLSISKTIAESHLGSLKIDCDALQTRFVLRLPADRPKKTEILKTNIKSTIISPEMISYL
jgi:C4-dicarboxylate-specific signal transduction histidine kinase